MPIFKSISLKMDVLQEGGQNLPSPCVCYPKDDIRIRVKKSFMKFYGRYQDLIVKYQRSVKLIVNNSFPG